MYHTSTCSEEKGGRVNIHFDHDFDKGIICPWFCCIIATWGGKKAGKVCLRSVGMDVQISNFGLRMHMRTPNNEIRVNEICSFVLINLP